MRVAIATSGRFHVCDLARELSVLGQSVAFYSLVPPRRLHRFGLPRGSARGFALRLAPLAALEAVAGRGRQRVWDWQARALDRLVSRHLEPCDVLVAMSGIYVRALDAARRRYGVPVVLERGSRHVSSQREILKAAPGRSDGISDQAYRRELEGYARADVIAVPSQHVLDSFVENGVSRDKLFLNPYGVDVARFSPTPAPAAAPPTILHVGRWSHQKGVDVLVQAWRRLPGVVLMHVGPPGDAPLPRDAGFEHHPAVDQAALPRFYARAHALALPSRQEGFGLVLAQALACGVPVVASSLSGAADLQAVCGGGPELVRIVPPGEVEPLVQALGASLSFGTALRGSRDLLSRGAREQISWRAFAERFLRMLEPLVGARGGVGTSGE